MQTAVMQVRCRGAILHYFDDILDIVGLSCSFQRLNELDRASVIGDERQDRKRIRVNEPANIQYSSRVAADT